MNLKVVCPHRDVKLIAPGSQRGLGRDRQVNVGHAARLEFPNCLTFQLDVFFFFLSPVLNMVQKIKVFILGEERK